MTQHRVERSTGRPSFRAGASTARALGLVLLLATTGCAGLGMPGVAPEDHGSSADPTAPVPIEGPPEFQVLVAQELEAEGRLEEATAAYLRALSVDPDSGFLHRRVAELAARQNDLELALEHAERALEQDPGDEGIRLFLGTLYRFRRDVDEASRVLLGEDGHPTSPEAGTLLYGILSDQKRFEDAREIASWLVETEPEAPRSFLALADAEGQLERHEEAEAALRRGLIEHPDDLTLYGALARGRRERGDREGEVAIYREVLGAHEAHHATLLAKADAELALGRGDDARATLEEVEREHPRDVRTLLRLGFLDFEQGEFGAASTRFRRALEQQPEQDEVAYFLAVSLRRDGQDEEAAAILEQIGPEHPRFSDARTQLASQAEKAGDFEAAMGYVEEARRVAPDRALDLYLASLQAKAGDVIGALALLESLLDEEGEGDDADVLYNIGIIHGEADNVDQALATMDQVLGMDPNHAGALNYVGYTLAERGERLDEAEEMIHRALEQRPEDGYITDSLGWIYYMRARPLVEAGRLDDAQTLIEQAKEVLQRASDLTGGDPVITEHLGDVFLLQGDRKRALELYEHAWQVGPRIDEQPLLGEKLERLRRELQAQ